VDKDTAVGTSFPWLERSTGGKAGYAIDEVLYVRQQGCAPDARDARSGEATNEGEGERDGEFGGDDRKDAEEKLDGGRLLESCAS
jgi:hypothetical protein